jgi:hypothetical protein
MNYKNYNQENWKDLLEKDWEYLRQDNGTANIEAIIEHLLTENYKLSKERK